MTLTRRQILGTIGTAAAATALPGLPAFAQSRQIRHFWWGNPKRDANTFNVIDLFQTANPEIAVSGETIGWGDYWTKMATQTAGGNMADVIQMAHTFIHEYVGRGAILPLDEHIGNGINLDHYDAGANDVGTIDGKLYGINIGSTTQAIPFNIRAFEDAGVDVDTLTWTTDDLATICQQITDSSGGKMRGSEDLSLYLENLEVWVRSTGRDLYSEDGKLEMTAEDVSSYWTFWGDLRDAGIVEGKDATVILDKGMAELGITKGSTAMTFRYANQVGAVQSLMQDPVGAARVPQRPGTGNGHYVLPSMFLCLTRDVDDVEAANAYIDNWINNPDALTALGIDRGIPPSQFGRDTIAPTLSEVDQKVVAFFGGVQDQVGPVPNAAPKGAGEVRDSFMRTGTEVVLGNMSADEAAGQFIRDAEGILIRASR